MTTAATSTKVQARKRMVRTPFRMVKILALVLLMVLIILFICYYILSMPVNPAANLEIEVNIGSNFTAREVGKLLAGKGLIRSQNFFVLYTRLTNTDHKIKSGGYLLSPADSLKETVHKLVVGDVVFHTFTIPEGLELKKIANILEKKGLVDREKFLKLAVEGQFDFEFCKILPEESKSLEGFLFPDTYQVREGAGEEQILIMMLHRFEKVYGPQMRRRAQEIGWSDLEVVTLASIIEREARSTEERALISGVFHNRLERGWPLQSCATVQYALGETREKLFYKDLKVESPYNTYQHSGLPPGPIASPGRASLEAALNPAKTDYLYFVAKPDGTHHFSRTLAEHNAAKQRYSQQ